MQTFVDNSIVMAQVDSTLYNLNKITSLLSCKDFLHRYGINHSSTRGLLFNCYFCKFPCLKVINYQYDKQSNCYSCNKCNEVICNSCISLLQTEMNVDINSNKQITGSFHSNQDKYDQFIQTLETSNSTKQNIRQIFSTIIKSDRKLTYNRDELAKLIASEEYAIGPHCPTMYEIYNMTECNWCKLYKPFIKDISKSNKYYSDVIILFGSICFECCNQEKSKEVFICNECSIIINKIRTQYYPTQSEQKYIMNDSYSTCQECFNLKKPLNINLQKEIDKIKNKFISQIISKITSILEIKVVE